MPRRTRRQVDRVSQGTTEGLVRIPAKRSEASNQRLEPEVLAQPDDAVLKAFQAGDFLNLIYSDPSKPDGIKVRRQKAEHSCFVRKDVHKNIDRMFRSHPDVRWVGEEEDGWLRVVWIDRFACKKYCKQLAKKGIQTYEGLVNPVLRYMADQNAHIARPRTAFVDLETDSRLPFSQKEKARTLAWCVVSLDQQRRERFVLQEDSVQGERALYGALWEVLRGYDQVCAWNGDGFDFVVMEARTRFLKLEKLWGSAGWRRWLWLDHLELFRKMNMMAAESGEEKQSFKLDDIAQAVLGVGKHDFDASKTWEAWQEGGERRQALIDYCEQDTLLMPQLEEKTGYIELLRTIGEVCGTFADSRGIQPSVQVDSYMQRLALRRKIKFPTAINVAKSEKYLGAYVLHPTRKGIQRDVHVADFASLYPSIIRTWNMSPETLVDSIWTGDLSRDSHHARESGLSLSPLTGATFDTGKPGILPEAVAEMMRLRKEWNTKKAKATPGTSEWKDADRRSTAYKITANSFYGVIGQPTSRLFDRQVAEAVTQCGRWLIEETIRAAEERGMDVIYGDTDSLFVVGSTRREFEDFVEWCNASLYPKILQEVGCKENIIKLAYEKQFERIVFSTAKKYVGRYTHYKGTDADESSKPEIKGLEFKRGDSIRLARKMQEEVCHHLVGYQCEGPIEDPEFFEALLDRWKDRVLQEDIELLDVLASKSLSRPIEGYAVKIKKDGTEAKQPPHVEIAKRMRDKGQDVTEGVKIRYFVKSGWPTVDYVSADEWDGDCDRYHLWDKQVFPASLRLLDAAFPGHDWKSWKNLGTKARKADKARQKADKEASKKATTAKAEPAHVKQIARKSGRRVIRQAEVANGAEAKAKKVSGRRKRSQVRV